MHAVVHRGHNSPCICKVEYMQTTICMCMPDYTCHGMLMCQHAVWTFIYPSSLKGNCRPSMDLHNFVELFMLISRDVIIHVTHCIVVCVACNVLMWNPLMTIVQFIKKSNSSCVMKNYFLPSCRLVVVEMLHYIIPRYTINHSKWSVPSSRYRYICDRICKKGPLRSKVNMLERT